MRRFTTLINNLPNYNHITFKADEGEFFIDPVVISCSSTLRRQLNIREDDKDIEVPIVSPLLSRFNFELLASILPDFLTEMDKKKDKWIEDRIITHKPLNVYINSPYCLECVNLKHPPTLYEMSDEQTQDFMCFLDYLELEPREIYTKIDKKDDSKFLYFDDDHSYLERYLRRLKNM